ncbi:unnamed protein product [Allacma fusca]|uniref:Arrestin C-terminal-like domain-containing protein n=1 Tax=Allacma fusca TaxID=39272 RepID=A0A8J2KZ48_9HEXA|nr:unnamed protein product [Allacma fusca]
MSIPVRVDLMTDSTIVNAGQELIGLLEIVVPDNGCVYKTKEITIEIEGSVEWKLDLWDAKLVKSHVFLKENVRVFGDGKQHSIIESGTKLIPFRISLPTNSPSSLEFKKLGGIYYSVGVKIQRDANIKNNCAIFPFYVQGVLDVTTPYFTNHPINATVTNQLHGIFSDSGLISFTLKMRRDLLLSGNSVPFILLVDNRSDDKVSRFEVSLYQTVLMRGFDGAVYNKMCYPVTSEERMADIPTGLSQAWNDGVLKIPSMLPPTNKTSTLITIDYHLKVKVHLKGSSPISHIVPVVIGFKPLPEEENSSV